jgi:hypothetical protein
MHRRSRVLYHAHALHSKLGGPSRTCDVTETPAHNAEPQLHIALLASTCKHSDADRTSIDISKLSYFAPYDQDYKPYKYHSHIDFLNHVMDGLMVKALGQFQNPSTALPLPRRCPILPYMRTRDELQESY